MKQILIIFFVILLVSQCFGAGSNANFKITAEIMDAGSAVSSNASYKLLGKMRERQTTASTNSGFNFNEGFLRSVYFGVTPPAPLAPIVTSITPATGENTGTVNITNLAGTNFQTGATVKLSKSGQTDILATSVVVVSSTQITCTLDLTGRATGLWDLTVTNTDGRAGTLPSAFTIAFAAPTVASITPSKGVNNAVVNITDLIGSNFRSGASVRLSKLGEGDIIGTNIVVQSSTKIICSFDLTGKTVGIWDVVAANDDNKSGTLSGGFKIEAPTVSILGPVISSQNPYNPAIGSTSINYTLTKDTDVTINIFSIRGEKIWQRTFPAGQEGSQAGINQVIWNGLTDFQSSASFGVYIVQITSKSNGSIVELGRTKIAVVK